MNAAHDVVILFDVDNTLLDNDAVERDLRRYLRRSFGEERERRYWIYFEQIRVELGYADYLGALQRYRLDYPRDRHLLDVSMCLVNYPFANRLYPGALAAIAYCRRWGPTVVLSDGDVVFQSRKVERSGIGEAVEGQILIYVHKEAMLDDVECRYPARHYLMVDDKRQILAAMKGRWRDRLTTILVRQGRYARDPAALDPRFAPDITLERIGALIGCELPLLLHAAGSRAAAEETV